MGGYLTEIPQLSTAGTEMGTQPQTKPVIDGSYSFANQKNTWSVYNLLT